MRIPVNDLESNWAYMVMAALAWNLKAWYGLLMPDRSRGEEVVKMERMLSVIKQSGERNLLMVEAYIVHVEKAH